MELKIVVVECDNAFTPRSEGCVIEQTIKRKFVSMCGRHSKGHTPLKKEHVVKWQLEGHIEKEESLGRG